ncbi:MAG TPA: GNAT family protein [Acidimicrobiales bacterium]|nr:GNAT family protein [Acidimicrobiales bacterium]
MPASTDDPDRPPAPTLDGRRIRLRPATVADRDRLREILLEPSVAQWWGPPRPGVDVADDWLEVDRDTVVFAFEFHGGVIGSIQYSEEIEPDYRHAGNDLFVATAWQGMGLGTDAIRTLAHFLFEVREHHRLVIDPSAANERAIAAYRKVGFVPVGVMRAYERGPDGTFHDGLLLDLLADELT